MPASLRKRTESDIMSRFSSSVVCRASVTWKSHVLPNMVHTGAEDAVNAFRFASSEASVPGLRVLPKAESFAADSFGGSSKRRSSTGLDPGHPPSM